LIPFNYLFKVFVAPAYCQMQTEWEQQKRNIQEFLD